MVIEMVKLIEIWTFAQAKRMVIALLVWIELESCR